MLPAPSGLSGIALNVTVVQPSAAGFVTVFPCGEPRPDTSSVNYAAGQTVPNGVIAPVGANGEVCFHTKESAHLIVDVAGWFEGDALVATTPKRLVDTRSGLGSPAQPVTPDAVLEIQVAGEALSLPGGGSTTVPSEASAAAMNFTVVNPSAAGFVTVFPCGEAVPDTSNLNYAAGDVVANGVIAPLGEGGRVCVFSKVPTDLVVDVSGYFDAENFLGTVPTRLVDTRFGTGGVTRLGDDGQIVVPIRGVQVERNGQLETVPAGALAAALNVTTVNPAAAGFLTVFPCGVDRPDTSNVNHLAGQVVANNVIAPIGVDGTVCVYSKVATDVIVDFSGWFETSATGTFVGTRPRRLIDTRVGVGRILQTM